MGYEDRAVSITVSVMLGHMSAVHSESHWRVSLLVAVHVQLPSILINVEMLTVGQEGRRYHF